MVWRILVNFIRQPMLRLKTHSGFHDLFIKYIITSHLLMKRIASHAANMMTINKISQICPCNFSNTIALTQDWTPT